jgi:hypothetical protein
MVSWALQPDVQDARASDDRSTAPFDWTGSVLIAATLVLLTFSTRASASAAWLLAVLGALAGAAVIVHERRAPAPVLNLELFRRRAFVAGAAIIATQNLAMYSLLVQVPFLFGGRSPSDSRIGLAIIAMTATMAAASPAGGWLAGWIGLRPVVAAGGLLGAFGVAALGRLPPTADALDVAIRLMFVGIGLGMSTGPANAGAMSAVPPGQSAVASATVSMLRYLGAIVGTVILGFAFAGGQARHQLALWIFVAALASSAAFGAFLGRSDGEI